MDRWDRCWDDVEGIKEEESRERGMIVRTLPYIPASRTPRISSVACRSARNGDISVSSVSCGSLNHDETGTALFGWKMYDAGELSRMIVSVIGRPSCERSCKHEDRKVSKEGRGKRDM